jgi:hypothetical protein
MADYQVALVLLVSAAVGIALAVWMFGRFALRLRAALVSAVIAALVAGVGYWLGIGLAFTYLDVADGVAPPWWAGWVVGALFSVGLAAAAFGIALVAMGVWTAFTARRARGRGGSESAVKPTQEQNLPR